MAHPVQDVQIHGITQRAASAKHKKRWRVRWMVDGRAHDKVFATSGEANRYRSLLVAAHHRCERFDRDTGEPLSWQPRTDPLQVHAWARRWVAEQWPEWQPRTRASALEAMARFVPMVVAPSAPAPPEGLRRYLMDTLPPDSEVSESDPCERWLARWSFKLDELDRPLLAEVDRRLGLGKDGQALSGWTASRYRKLARACIRRAVELGLLPGDPWPPAPKGRSRRKAVRPRSVVDVRSLPDPQTMERALAAIPSHQPSSRTYQVMIAVMYYGGLRPSETIMLRPRALQLPDEGWGRIDVVEGFRSGRLPAGWATALTPSSPPTSALLPATKTSPTAASMLSSAASRPGRGSSASLIAPERGRPAGARCIAERGLRCAHSSASRERRVTRLRRCSGARMPHAGSSSLNKQAPRAHHRQACHAAQLRWSE